MKTMKRTLSVILAVLMLLSIVPISVSAADPIQLKLGDPLLTVVPPTVTPTEFKYGKLYGELEITGGEVYYNGSKVEGTFSFGSRYTTRAVTAGESYARLYFEPTDTTTYKASNIFSYKEEYNIANWPKFNVTPLDAEYQGEATACVAVGSTLNTAVFDGKVVNAETKEEITNGKWRWTSNDTSSGNYQIIYIDGVYEATWSCTGYNDIVKTFKVTATPSDVPATGLVYRPTTQKGLVYHEDMRLAEVALHGGLYVYEGQEVAGHWEWGMPQGKVRADSNSSTGIYFYPDDPAIAEKIGEVYSNASYYIPSTAGDPATVGITEIPTTSSDLYYFNGMTLKDIPLNGGKAVYDGKEIEGTFEWIYPDREVSLEGETGSAIKFIPKDETLAATFSKISAAALYDLSNSPVKKTLEITKQPESLTFVYKTYITTSAKADTLGFEFGGGIDASAVTVSWEKSIKELDVGTYETEITINAGESYEEKKITLPVIVEPIKSSSKFGNISINTVNSNNEGVLNVSLAYHDQYKSGTAKVTLTDGTNTWVLGEDIPPTYVAGEKSKSKILAFEIEEPGTYTFTATAEYTAGENDKIVFTDATVTSHSVTITVKPWRTLTAVNTTFETSTLKTYEGRQIPVSTSIPIDKFDCWEITDSQGNVIAPETLGLTEEEMKKTSILLYMPDYDITVTAKEKGLLPDINLGGGDDGEDSLWAKIVAFFTNLFSGIGSGDGECPVLKWICRIIELIVAFFTGFFNGLVS